MRPVTSFAVWAFVRTVHATLRVRHVHPRNLTDQKQYIMSFWHEHVLFMLHSRWRHPIKVMISRSKDGQISFGVFQRYGVESAKGSSSKGGGTALRELIRATRAGRNIVFTPDGPKGPPRIAKSGVIFAAQASGLPIVPIALASKKKSACARGTGWSSRSHSAASSTSTASRSSCRVTATSRNGAFALRMQ